MTHVWIVEYICTDGNWMCWSAHPSREEARAAAREMHGHTRIRKFIPE